MDMILGVFLETYHLVIIIIKVSFCNFSQNIAKVITISMSKIA